MVDAFEAISFLTRSENRVDVLTGLAGGPHTERELVAATGVSDVTVGRILDDFAARGWVVEREDGYERTRVGDLVAADYEQFADSMDLACRLGPVRDLFPVAEFPFDLRLLTDARVSDPDRFDPLRAVDRWKELLRGADRFVGVAPAATGTTVVAEPFHEEITEHGLSFSAVVSQQYYETVTSRAEARRLVREELEAGAEMYLATDETEFQVSVAAFDDVATISAYDDAGNLQAGIETRAEPVYGWVLDTYESHREDATRLTPEDFAE
jgi:predicted transcriptional regulator